MCTYISNACLRKFYVDYDLLELIESCLVWDTPTAQENAIQNVINIIKRLFLVRTWAHEIITSSYIVA